MCGVGLVLVLAAPISGFAVCDDNLVVTGRVHYAPPGCDTGVSLITSKQATVCHSESGGAPATQAPAPASAPGCDDRPLRRARVELRDGRTRLFATTTDAAGEFEFCLHNPDPGAAYDLNVAVYLCTDGGDDGDACGEHSGSPNTYALTVTDPDGFVYKFDRCPPLFGICTDTAPNSCTGTVDFDIVERAAPASEAYRLFDLLANEPADFLAHEVGWVDAFDLAVRYPATASGFRPDATINVAAGDAQDDDVVLTNYALYILQHLTDGGLAPTPAICAQHSWDGQSTPECAWVFGWSMFLASAIQGDPVIHDTPAPGAPPSLTLDLEGPAPPATGAKSDGAIAASLWDLFDGAEEDWDHVALGLAPIWQAVASGSPTDACGFRKALYALVDPARPADAIYAHHRVDCFISYVGLGDSYSSGEGVPPYEIGTDDEPNFCHRSTAAYSTRITAPDDPRTLQSLAKNAPGYEWSFLACSGATTDDVRRGGTSPKNGPNEPAQLDQHRVDRGTDMVALTVGGNDLGFAKILEWCFLSSDCLEEQPFKPYTLDTVAEWVPKKIGRVGPLVEATYRDILDIAPDASVFALGYPLLVSGSVCDAVRRKISLLTFELSESEQAFLRQTAVSLNSEIAAAAARAGVHFVGVANRFAGHEVCSKAPWIFGLRTEGAPWDKTFVKPESFHPTREGQAAYAIALNAYVADKVHNGWQFCFQSNGLPRNPPPVGAPSPPAPAEPALPTLGPLDVAPATPPPCPTANAFVPGQAIRVRGDGFAPNESVTIRLRSAASHAETPLAMPAVDATGRLDAVATIPLDAARPDVALVEALGAGPEGAGRLLDALVAVGESLTTDGDGDGVPDVCDLCPFVSNAGQADADGDGVGDACDPCPDDFEDACSPAPVSTTTTMLGPLPTPTTTTTAPRACVSDAACADADACTADTCDPSHGCRHVEPPASAPGAARCVVTNVRALLAEAPQPSCTKRCPKQLAKTIADADKLVAKVTTATRAKCLRSVTAARRKAVALEHVVARLAAKGGFTPVTRGQRLHDEASRLIARLDALKRSACTK